jgi:hypothetical protein
VLRAQGGDREAFDALLAAVQEPLFGFVAAITGDRGGAMTISGRQAIIAAAVIEAVVIAVFIWRYAR